MEAFMRFQVLNSITSTDLDKWNQFVIENNGSVFHSYEWLLAYEKSAPHDSKAFHIIMTDNDDNWLGLIPVFATINCPRFKKWRLSFVENPTTIEEPILLSHSVYSFYGYPLVAREEKEIYLELLNCYRKLAIEQNIPVYGFISIPEDKKVLIECLKETGFTVNLRTASSLIDIKWDTYEQYLKTFPRKLRADIRWMENKYEKQGIQFRIDDPKTQLDMLYQMVNSVFVKHKRSVDIFPRQYLEELINDFGEKLLIVTAAAGDEVVCMNLCLSFGKTLVPWIAGINYEAIGNLSYHHFYAWIIKYAIENGYSAVDCGRSAFEEKQKYGYYRTNLYFCLNTTTETLRDELVRWTNELEDYSIKRLPK